MKISVSADVFKAYPQLRLAFMVIQDINNTNHLAETQHLLQETQKIINLSFNKDTIKTHHLLAPWKIAQQEFGVNAHHYHTSLEKLLQNVLHNKKIIAADSLTNLCNHLALTHLIPLSVDDFDEINGKIAFNIAIGKEKAHFLRKLKKNDLYYKDEKKIIGTKLDYWKTPKTKLTPITKNALLHAEFLPPISPQQQRKILAESSALIKNICGGKVKTIILDKKNRIAIL